MGLITIHGLNPFSGQKDPWIGMDANISFEDNGEESIANTYTLNGVLSGCDYDTLAQRRDALASSFDWKADPSITGSIVIQGLDKSASGHALVPRSVSFASSNYVGAIPYTITIESFTGHDFGDSSDTTDNLIDKVHTVSTTINEKGCASYSTNISCTPNGAYTGNCGALEEANAWITSQLGVQKIGATTLSSAQDLQSESLTIDPLTSAVSYSSTAGIDCDNTKDANAKSGKTYNIAHCTEKTTDNTQCNASDQIVKVKHNGEIYHSGKTQQELMSELNSEYLSSYDGISNFGGTYNAAQDTVSFNFETHLDGNGAVIDMPKDLLINNYTINTSTTYAGEDDEKDQTNGSIGGSIIIENRIEKPLSEILNYDTSYVKDLAKEAVGGSARLTSESVTKDELAGTHSYSYAFNQTPDNPDETPALDGYSGITNYSINYTPALNQFETVANLNCDDLIFDKGHNSEGNVTISVSATSGSGYDFETNGDALLADLKNQVIKNQTNLDITKDDKKMADDKKSAKWTYAASFTADSAIEQNEITSMY